MSTIFSKFLGVFAKKQSDNPDLYSNSGKPVTYFFDTEDNLIVQANNRMMRKNLKGNRNDNQIYKKEHGSTVLFLYKI